jgi:hypothetical protein
MSAAGISNEAALWVLLRSHINDTLSEKARRVFSIIHLNLNGIYIDICAWLLKTFPHGYLWSNPTRKEGCKEKREPCFLFHAMCMYYFYNLETV